MILAQLLKLASRHEFERLAAERKSGRMVRKLAWAGLLEEGEIDLP